MSFNVPVFALRLFLSMAFIFSLMACTVMGEQHYSRPSSKEAVRIFVVRQGWHTEIAIPHTEGLAPFTFLDPLLGKAAYYQFGWGDRNYYPAEDPGFWLTLQAGLLPTSSVLHIAVLAGPPPETFPGAEVETLLLSQRGYRQLLRYFTGYFVLDDQGRPLVVEPGLYRRSLFFQSQVLFHVFDNCNTWTARALRRGGVPIRVCPTLTAGSVMAQVRAVTAESLQVQNASNFHPGFKMRKEE